jgi:hypothetical protein
MAALLKLNINSLEYDEYKHSNIGPKKPQPQPQPKKSKSFFGISSSSISQPVAEEPPDFIQIPLTYDPDDWLNLIIMQDFLQPNSTMSVEEAVRRIIEVHATWEEAGSIHFSTGPFISAIAKQIPYSHPSQLKLARLLLLLGRSPERLEKLPPKVFECFRDPHSRRTPYHKY